MYRFIINPNCRSGAGQAIWNEIHQELDKRGVNYEFALTKYVGHACRIASHFTSDASADYPIHLVVLGGDGTIHEALSGILNVDYVIFGFIPAGSGNDFCRSTGLPNDPLEALDCLLTTGKVDQMDLPVVRYGNRSSRFGISCGIGYDAAVCHEVLTSPLKKVFNRLHLGKLVYVMIALKQMLFTAPADAVIEVDGEKHHFPKTWFVAVMNQKYEGGGFRFCPDAKPNDGILDVIAVEGMSRLKMLSILPTGFWGGHTRFKGIHILKCKKAVIRCDQPAAVHIDGESGGTHHGLEVTLEPFQLSVIVPNK